MPSTQTQPHVTFQIAEEGEAIGTVQQFADQTDLPRTRVLSCLEQNGTPPVVLPTREGEDRLLITDADGLAALLCCAADEALS